MKKSTRNTFAKSMVTCLSSATLLVACGGGGDSSRTASQASAGSSGVVQAMAAEDSCHSVAWAMGQFYSLGTVVKYEANGRFYKLVNVGANGSDGTDPTVSTWYWSPVVCDSGTDNPGTDTGNNNGTGNFVVSEDQFNQMFPGRGPFYTYKGLVGALTAYPAFANTGSDTVRKQEVAAFLANVSHETGGLVYVDEINTALYKDYCHNDAEHPYGCPAGVEAYHGRGPLQLSHNYNYKAAADDLGLDLLNHPEWVSNNPEVSWKTGIWYWMLSKGGVGVTAHDSMVNGSGFGMTIKVINGGLECNGANSAQMQDRVNTYQRFTQILGVPAGDNLGC